MPARIKVKVTDNIRRSEQMIIDTLVRAVPDLVILNAYEIREGAILLIENEQNITELLKATTTAKLRESHLEVTPPEWYLPEKTVFISRVRHDITCLHTEIIQSEINRTNSIKADEVMIIPNSRKTRYGHDRRKTMKVTFSSKENADHAILNGISMFNTKIPPHQLSKQRYSTKPQCYKCFQYTHKTIDCNSERQFCSICSREHHYKRCPTPNRPCCINCKGNHIAVFKGCKVYQDLINLPSATVTVNNTSSATPDIASVSEFPRLPGQNPPTQDSTPINNREQQSAPVNAATNNNTAYETRSEVTLTPKKILENDLKREAISNYALMKARCEDTAAKVYIENINKMMVANNMSPIIMPEENTDSDEEIQILHQSSSSTPQSRNREDLDLPFSLHTPTPLTPKNSPQEESPKSATPTYNGTALPTITEDSEESQQVATPPSSNSEPTSREAINTPDQGAIPKKPKSGAKKLRKRKAVKKMAKTIESESERDYDSDTSQSQSLNYSITERQPSRMKQARSLTRRGQIEHKYELRRALAKAVRKEIRQIRLEEAASDEQDEETELRIVISEEENNTPSPTQME